ncbi:uncharacterized protein I206_101611 [Kwoniella pini CBS 10737]|uniref:Protein kinase domain-containing protein n=1 Tax=Kwoniella pini CBS 10737 TaxID=1296096 RepID=A0A1B9HW98_9TREE|nr:uncharacterized protein I206_06419 [Kwoniella pini CBS 10737]OCF47518.1 hypothetical protein I206_06419 [Kwoniella pini CBS 10737]
MSFQIKCIAGLTEGRSHMESGLIFHRYLSKSRESTRGETDKENTEGWNESLSASSSSPASVDKLSQPQPDIVVITEHIKSGYLWDFWLGNHSKYGQVVLKLVSTWDYPCMREGYWEYIAPEDILGEAVNEERFYTGPLIDLQGNTIPTFYGTYLSSDGENYCAILLEYAGHAIGPGLVQLDEEWRNNLYEAYQKIHLRGVSHGDTSSRHVLIDDQHRIRLVGFRKSAPITLTDGADVLLMMYEAIDVRVQIGNEKPSVAQLHTLPAIYYDQVTDRDEFIKSIQPCSTKEFVLPDYVAKHDQWLKDQGLFTPDLDSDDYLSDSTCSSLDSDEKAYYKEQEAKYGSGSGT